MAAVWGAVTGLLETLARATAGRGLAALGVTAQGDGCWLADAAAEPVRKAILWNDGRTADWISARLADGTLRRLHAIGHFTGFPGTPASLLPWLATNEPESIGRTRTVFTCSSWIYRRLTGVTCIDAGDAAVPFMDPRRQTYSAELVSATEMAGVEALLPPIAAGPRRPDHGLLADVASAASLPAGLPVILAPYDVPAAALGAGCVEEGDLLMVLGTTFLTGKVVSDHPLPPFGGTNVPLGRTGRQLQFFPALVGMETLAWAARTLGFPGVKAAVDTALGAASRGALFLPYLSPAGERAPFLDPQVRGGFAGLSLDHTPANLVRAVLEGLTMALLDCARACGPGRRLTVCGGGANSDGWCQMLADATGLDVHRPAASELSARGAALVALAAATGEDEAGLALRWRRDERTWIPVAAERARYEELFRRFVEAREARRGRPGTSGGRP
jgi:xylulokinase